MVTRPAFLITIRAQAGPGQGAEGGSRVVLLHA